MRCWEGRREKARERGGNVQALTEAVEPRSNGLQRHRGREIMIMS